MSKIQRIVCLLLVFTFAVGLIACDKGNNPQTDTKASTDTNQPSGETEETNPLAGLDYKGELFTIQTSVNVDTASFSSSNYLIQGEEEASADKAANSALERNKKVESDLNIKLNYIESDYDFTEVNDKVRELVKAGADGVHLIINDVSLTRLSTEQIIHDASYGEYFDFSQKYWYDEFMRSSSLNYNTRFMLAGDYFIDITRSSHCLLMNKDYYREIGCDPDSVYDLVRNGDWTLDTLYTIIKGGEDGSHPTYQDIQGNHKRDRRDKWGLVLWQWWGPMIPWLATADPGYIARDSEGYPSITVNNERTVALIDKLSALFNADETAVGVHTDNQDTIDNFVEGNILFLTYQRLGSLESQIFANAELDLAVLPYPKLDEFQKDYVSTIHDTSEAGFIPITVSFANLGFVSAVIEALSRSTAETVMQKYYESTLKIRYARESANAEMIQLIHDTYGNAFPLVWDFPESPDIFTSGMYESISKNQSSFASFYRSTENSANTALQQSISDMKDVLENIQTQYNEYLASKK